MLGKLIKYDIRSTWRDFAAAYACIFLGVLILPQVFRNVTNEIVQVIAGFLAVGIAVATIVVLVIMLFRIFNTNVFSKEGYLTMTLPVTLAEVVKSKLIVSSMWVLLTEVISAIGIFAFLSNMELISFNTLFETIGLFLSLAGSGGKWTIALLAAGGILSIIKEVAKLFLACSIAHLKQLDRKRTFVGILSYFVFSWLEVLLVQGIGLFVSLLPSADAIIRQLVELNHLNHIAEIPDLINLFNMVLVAGNIYSLVLIVAFALGTIWMLNRKLDLD